MTLGTDNRRDRTRILADGHKMPKLGLGVWQIPDGPECVRAVHYALELGYRHIDTAQEYGNEESVGRALRDSGVPRHEIFLTTKFHPFQGNQPVSAAEQSLRRLGVDWVDLYLVHWPEGGPTWAWPGMEQVQERSLARSIGVSNFSTSELEEVIGLGSIPPVLNQIELNPLEYRAALISACRRHNVAAEAYSPLGTGQHLSNEVVVRIAQRISRTPAQVLLRWCLQHDLLVISKSIHRDRIAKNAEIFDFALSSEDMADLDALDETGGTSEALETKWW